MTICLIRHGKPTVSIREKIRGNQVLNFITRYNSASIAKDSIPPKNLITVVQNANVIFTSNLNRAIDSATILQPQIQPISQSIFREIDCWRTFSTSIKLSAISWGIICSILWKLQIPPITESPAATRQRAKQTAALLIKNYYYYGSVVLIAHGGINTFIAKELRLLGWQGSQKINNQHWGYTEYSYIIKT